MKKRFALLLAAVLVVALVPVYGVVTSNPGDEGYLVNFYTGDGGLITAGVTGPSLETGQGASPAAISGTSRPSSFPRAASNIGPREYITADVSGVSATVRQSGNQANITMSRSVINEIINETLNEISNETINQTTGNTVIIDVSGLSENITSARMPRLAFELFADAGLGVHVKLPNGVSFRYDQRAVQSLANFTASGVISMSVTEATSLTFAQWNGLRDGDVVYNVRIRAGNHFVSQLAGNVSVTVPYSGPAPFGAWHVTRSGVFTLLSSRSGGEAGTVTFDTNQFSHFVVGINDGDWNAWR